MTDRKIRIVVDQEGNAQSGLKNILETFAGFSLAGIAGKAVGGIEAVGGAAFDAGKQLIELGSDANEMESAFNVAFGEEAVDARKELEKFGDTVGRSTYDLEEMAGATQSLLTPLGLSREKAAGMSIEMTKLAVDLSSFKNVSEEIVQQDIQSALVGNTEGMRKYGVAINAAAIEQEAMRLGLVQTFVNQEAVSLATDKVALAQRKYNEAVEKSGADSTAAQSASIALQSAQMALEKATAGTTGELDAQAKAQAVLSLITKQTTDAQGDAERTSGGWANQMRAVNATLSEAATAAGQELIPVLLPLLQQFGAFAKDIMPKAVEIFKEFIGNLKETAGPAMVMIEDAITRIAKAFGIQTDKVSGSDVVLGALKITLDLIITALKAFAVSMQIAADVIERIKSGVDSLKRVLDEVKRKWDEFGDAARAAADKIPDWMIPHSPTKFEIGLKGIADAQQQVNLNMRQMGPGVGAQNPAMGVSAAGGVINLTLVYQPMISLADRYEAEQVLKPFIQQGVRQALMGG